MSAAIGDCRAILPTLDAGRFACCVTSPPYWGLRDYGHPDQLGLEATPDEYVAHLVAVFREVRRVLRDDGTLWLNLGDCYATGAGKVGECPGGGEQGAKWAGSTETRGERTRALRDGRHAGKHTAITARGPMTQPNRMPQAGLKPKDLVGIPWRVAFALQADGWWLRSDIIWHKPAPMPESVTDRPTKSHEYLFLLSKSASYYYDAAAISEPATYAGRVLDYTGEQKNNGGDPDKQATLPRGRKITVAETRNARTVWTIGTAPYSGAHFATMPPALAQRCILAGSRLGDEVLDPFLGSGTVGQVAEANGRRWFGCEINPEYGALIADRTRQVGLLGGAR